MKIKEGFKLRNICGEKVIIAEGRENIDFTKMFSLNESSAFLWESVADSDFNATTLKNLLLEEYDVDEATAQNDAERILKEWSNLGLISK